MQISKTINKTAYTAFLVVVYTAFLFVHSYFRIAHYGANPGFSSSYFGTNEKKANTKEKKANGKELQKKSPPAKRFQPSSGFLTPSVFELSFIPPLFTTCFDKELYTSPFQIRRRTGKPLRAPPIHKYQYKISLLNPIIN